MTISSLEELSPELIGEFVQAAHFDFARVKTLHQQHAALLNARWEKFNELAIEAAGHMRQRETAEYLLDQDAPLDIFVAAMLGRRDQVAGFLQTDPALADARGIHGFSVFYHAALSGNIDVLELIYTSGGRQGMDQALHAATRFHHSHVVAWLLVHHVENIDIVNIDNKTPLHIAEEKGYSDIVALLRQHGANG